MEETWAEVPGFKDYTASSLGKIKYKERVIKQYDLPLGYKSVSIRSHGSIGVHRVVCLAFHGIPPKDKPHVNHIDVNPSNNAQWNLEWVSRSENIIHSRWHRIKDKNDAASKLKKLIYESGQSISSISKSVGFPLLRFINNFNDEKFSNYYIICIIAKYLKLTPSKLISMIYEDPDRITSVKELVEIEAQLKGLTMNSLSEVTEIPVTTLWRRLNDPDQFTICEVKKLADALGLKMKTLIG